jgi:pimeloyl-ACP methyl ester carboxylesterase
MSLSNQTQSPLIGLHGGPGKPQATLIDHLLISVRYGSRLPDSARGSLRDSTYSYDQIGNARSTHFSDPPKPATFWTIDLFVDELENLVKFFGLEKREYYLLGHSWGGILAAEFEVRRHSSGLKGIVLSDLLADMGLWGKSNMELMSKFPAHVQEDLKGGFRDLKNTARLSRSSTRSTPVASRRSQRRSPRVA